MNFLLALAIWPVFRWNSRARSKKGTRFWIDMSIGIFLPVSFIGEFLTRLYVLGVFDALIYVGMGLLIRAQLREEEHILLF